MVGQLVFSIGYYVRKRRPLIPPPRLPKKKTSDPRALAPLTKHDPSKIVPKHGRDDLAEFCLTLAVVFNDLKGLLVWEKRISELAPSDVPLVSPKSGEFYGLRIQFHRLLAAQFHELLKLIKAFEDVVGAQPLRNILKKAPPSIQHQWDDLVAVATGKGTPRDKAFAQILVETRNNAAYHYYQPKVLLAGFRRTFFETPPGPLNQFAFASIGASMEQSRFYYADAAMEAALTTLAGKSMEPIKFKKLLAGRIDSVNRTVEYILSVYLQRAKLPRDVNGAPIA